MLTIARLSMKLDKSVVQRRLDLMAAEGVVSLPLLTRVMYLTLMITRRSSRIRMSEWMWKSVS